MLEIGVGPNGFAPFYASHVSSFIGLDIDDYTSSYSGISNIRIYQYDGITFPLPDKCLDLIVSHSVFEHIQDVEKVLMEINRVLKVGGHFYLTINPLYFSSWGSHGTFADHKTKLPDWEHLNPQSEYFMTDCPPQLANNGLKGCYLNKLVLSELLYFCGKLPWQKARYSIDNKERERYSA